MMITITNIQLQWSHNLFYIVQNASKVKYVFTIDHIRVRSSESSESVPPHSAPGNPEAVGEVQHEAQGHRQGQKQNGLEKITGYILVPQIDPSVPQPVVQSRRRPLLGPSPG